MTEPRYGLTDKQMITLMSPLTKDRVLRDDKGMSHLAAWDVRRYLTRVFGPMGWSVKTLSLELIHQTPKKFRSGADGWNVGYRAQVRLTLKNLDGQVLTSFEDGAVGGANLPKLDDAHDMAMKTALSQALKRCAMNLGDQFGLSLYNNGSTEPVGIWTAAWSPPADVQELPAATPDAVLGDPDMEQGGDQEDGYSAPIGADADEADAILFEALKRETQTATTRTELAAAGDRVKANLKKLSQAQIKELQQAWKDVNVLLISDEIDGQIETIRQGGIAATKPNHDKIMATIEGAKFDADTREDFVNQLNEAFDAVASAQVDASAPQ